jgi:hypothetical protein
VALRKSVVERWIKESIDVDYYDRLYTQQLFMTGDKRHVTRAIEGQTLYRAGHGKAGADLPEYPDILPDQGDVGVQNHALVNSRINVQGLTLAPEVQFMHADPLIRQVNSAYIRDLFARLDWSTELYLAGMEVEANGISSLRAGVTDDGDITWQHIRNLDVLYDRAHKSPQRWQWVCFRDRLTPEEAEAIYGSALTRDELARLVSDSEEGIGYSISQHGATISMKQVVEWSFYSKDYHCVFLGSIFGPDSVFLTLNSRGDYRKSQADDPDVGPNPFGVIPHAWWVDSWSPAVRRPVAKLDATRRLASMLMMIERFIADICRNGAPITAIDASGAGLDAAEIEKIKKARHWSEVGNVIVTQDDVSKVLTRIPAADIPEVAMNMYMLLREQINAATGVGDMQRGQALGGERRTRFEVQRLVDQSGIQARHFKQTAAKCIESMVAVTRAMGAQFQTKPQTLFLENMEAVDTREFPVKLFLQEEAPARVSPDSVVWLSEAERLDAAVMLLQGLYMPFIELGAMDPNKAMVHVFRRAGISNDAVKEFGLDPMMLMAQASQQQMAGQPEQSAPM